MAGVDLPDGTREATPQGVPQGGPLSPLLANIALDPLDQELECPCGLPPSSNHFPEEENADCMAGAERRQSRGHKFARYADDFIVVVKSACRNVSAADDADLAGTVTQRQILDWVELAGE